MGPRMEGGVIIAPLFFHPYKGQKMTLPDVELDMKKWPHFLNQNCSSLGLC